MVSFISIKKIVCNLKKIAYILRTILRQFWEIYFKKFAQYKMRNLEIFNSQNRYIFSGNGHLFALTILLLSFYIFIIYYLVGGSILFNQINILSHFSIFYFLQNNRLLIFTALRDLQNIILYWKLFLRFYKATKLERNLKLRCFVKSQK